MTANIALFAQIVSKLNKNSFRKLVMEKATDKHSKGINNLFLSLFDCGTLQVEMQCYSW